MPSHDMLVCRISSTLCIQTLTRNIHQLYFQSDLTLVRSWYIDGRHYSRTLEDWLQKQDQNARAGLSELENDAQAKGLNKQEGKKSFYR